MRILLQAQDKASAALDRVRQSGTGLAGQLVKNQQAVRALERDLRKADRWADYQQKIKAAEAETRHHAAAINKLAAEISAAMPTIQVIVSGAATSGPRSTAPRNSQ